MYKDRVITLGCEYFPCTIHYCIKYANTTQREQNISRFKHLNVLDLYLVKGKRQKSLKIKPNLGLMFQK